MTRNLFATTMAAVIAAVAASAPVSAIQNGNVSTTTISASSPNRADALRQQAEGLVSQPRQWGKAARLFEQSAQLRDASDPEAYICLIYASRLRAGRGDFAGARVALEKAASHAAARGAVLEAAHAWIDAAHAAVGANDMGSAHALTERAQLLAGSPLLSVSQAEQITRRITN
jgi:hypothetical protein